MLRHEVHSHTQSVRLNVFVGTLASLGVGIAATAAFHAHLRRPAMVVVVAAGIVAFKFLAVQPPTRGPIVHSFNLVEVVVILGVATLPAADLLTAAGLAAVVVLVGWPRCWHKTVYNAAELVIAAAVAAAIGHPTPVRTIGSAGLLAVAGMSYAVVSAGLAHTVLTVAQRARWSDLRDEIRPLARAAATSVPLGVLAAAVADRPFLLVLCLVPVGLLLLFAAAIDRAQVEHERASALATAGHAAVAATARSDLVDAMLASAARMAGGAARLATEPGPAGSLSIPLTDAFAPDRWLVVDAPPTRLLRENDPETALRTLVAVTATGLDNVTLRAALQQLATTDELTGLDNRREFVQCLDDAVRRARRGHPFGVLFVDLDRFKTINDTYGHATGDAVLREVATRLRAAVRASDRVFRLAGDEFTVVADGVADDATLTTLAATLAERVSGDVLHETVTVRVTASVGGAVWGEEHDSAWAVVAAADQRMYDAKSVPGPR